jgi:hypothetical protein
MREFAARGTQLPSTAGRLFARHAGVRHLSQTGYPPTDVESWMRVFEVCKSYGLNTCVSTPGALPRRFRGRRPFGLLPATRKQFVANQGATIGDGTPLDAYIYAESERMVKAYGNHPSFCMLAYGNEPAGKNHVKYLTSL